MHFPENCIVCLGLSALLDVFFLDPLMCILMLCRVRRPQLQQPSPRLLPQAVLTPTLLHRQLHRRLHAEESALLPQAWLLDRRTPRLACVGLICCLAHDILSCKPVPDKMMLIITDIDRPVRTFDCVIPVTFSRVCPMFSETLVSQTMSRTQ